jgi:DNA-binding transcriptional regulator YiaG
LKNPSPKKKTTMGHDLKEWRRRVGFTQAQAAVWFDVPLRTFQEWEQDRSEPAHPGPIKRLMTEKPKD